MSKIFILVLTALLQTAPSLEFYAGEEKIVCDKANGDIILAIDKQELIRITKYAFYVEGRKVMEDRELYEGFRSWLIENKGHLRVVK